MVLNTIKGVQIHHFNLVRGAMSSQENACLLPEDLDSLAMGKLPAAQEASARRLVQLTTKIIPPHTLVLHVPSDPHLIKLIGD